MKDPNPIVIVLLGPTASGKTSLAIEIAKRIELDVHNIDSRQLYKGMDIGTAKPSEEQQQQIKHFLIDIREPNEPLTLHEFQKIAISSLNTNLKKGKAGFLVGGSGLYIKSLTDGLCPPSVAPQPALRDQLRNLKPIECHQLLRLCDPIAAKRIYPADSSRTIRALEVFYATGKTMSSLKSTNPPKWNLLEIGLDPYNLQERISERTKNLYRGGLLEETEKLSNQFGKDLPLLQTIGYREALQVIRGELSIKQGIEITTQRTRKFAKRQRTWFRRQHSPKWLNETNPLEEALSLIQNVIGLSK